MATRGHGSEPDGDNGDSGEERWEAAELVAALDPNIARRLMEHHPDRGWCWECHASAPCSMRRLGEEAQRAAGRAGRPSGRRPRIRTIALPSPRGTGI